MILAAAGAHAAETSPGTAFRGALGSAVYDVPGLPTSWSEADHENIRWKADLAVPGWASPVTWKDKVIATGADSEHRYAWCFAEADGKRVWATEVPAVEGATEGYATDTMDPEWDARMYAASTPVTDGRRVYVLFSNGQLAALELADGKIAWNIPLGDTSPNTYGLSGSLRLHDGKLIVVFQGDKKSIAGYDAESGKPLWTAQRPSSTWASAALVKTSKGRDRLVLLGDPDLTAWDPATGKQAWSIDILSGKPDYNVGPSPVFDGKSIYVNCQGSGIYAVDPDTGAKRWGVEELPVGYGFADGVSMVAGGGRVYQYYGYVLSCLDAVTGKVLREREMDDAASYASPFLNGRHLYLVSVNGVRVVDADPGKGLSAIGTGSLDGRIEASPTVAGDAIFIRTDKALYCIGK